MQVPKYGGIRSQVLYYTYNGFWDLIPSYLEASKNGGAPKQTQTYYDPDFRYSQKGLLIFGKPHLSAWTLWEYRWLTSCRFPRHRAAAEPPRRGSARRNPCCPCVSLVPATQETQSSGATKFLVFHRGCCRVCDCRICSGRRGGGALVSTSPQKHGDATNHAFCNPPSVGPQN